MMASLSDAALTELVADTGRRIDQLTKGEGLARAILWLRGALVESSAKCEQTHLFVAMPFLGGKDDPGRLALEYVGAVANRNIKELFRGALVLAEADLATLLATDAADTGGAATFVTPPPPEPEVSA